MSETPDPTHQPDSRPSNEPLGSLPLTAGSALPSILCLNAHGQLYYADGREVTAYLREWAKRAGVAEETPLNIMRREDQQRERDDA